MLGGWGGLRLYPQLHPGELELDYRPTMHRPLMVIVPVRGVAVLRPVVSAGCRPVVPVHRLRRNIHRRRCRLVVLRPRLVVDHGRRLVVRSVGRVAAPSGKQANSKH